MKHLNCLVVNFLSFNNIPYDIGGIQLNIVLPTDSISFKDKDFLLDKYINIFIHRI